MGQPNFALDHLTVYRLCRQEDDQKVAPFDTLANLFGPVGTHCHADIDEYIMACRIQAIRQIAGESAVSVGLASVGNEEAHTATFLPYSPNRERSSYAVPGAAPSWKSVESARRCRLQNEKWTPSNTAHHSSHGGSKVVGHLLDVLVFKLVGLVSAHVPIGSRPCVLYL
jgi:hypothetical protein